jgi:hypothetical protein
MESENSYPPEGDRKEVCTMTHLARFLSGILRRSDTSFPEGRDDLRFKVEKFRLTGNLGVNDEMLICRH